MRWLLPLLLSGCASVEVSDRGTHELAGPSERLMRGELYGEWGNRAECVGHLTVQSGEFGNTLKAFRHVIDPMAPNTTMGAISFTYYWQRLERGCITQHIK